MTENQGWQPPWDAALDADENHKDAIRRLAYAASKGYADKCRAEANEAETELEASRLETALLFLFLLNTASVEPGIAASVKATLERLDVGDAFARGWLRDMEVRMRRLESDVIRLKADKERMAWEIHGLRSERPPLRIHTGGR